MNQTTPGVSTRENPTFSGKQLSNAITGLIALIAASLISRSMILKGSHFKVGILDANALFVLYCIAVTITTGIILIILNASESKSDKQNVVIVVQALLVGVAISLLGSVIGLIIVALS